MDPITGSLLIAGGSSLIGGIGNYLSNKSAADRAEMLYDKSFQEWLTLSIPDPAEQKLALEQFVVQGTLNPKMEQAIKADPSAFEDIVTSSEHKSAQNRALSELEKIGLEGGLRLQDKAALQDAMSESNARERGDRLAIQADAARRGTRGSGFELASQLQAQQSAADRNAKNSLSVSAQAQDRALQAIMGAGDMATKYRSQDFDQQAQKASAMDRINQFNTQNAQGVQQRNVGAMNDAQRYNLAQQQSTSDKNIAQNNFQQQYNKNLLQQKFENEARKKAGMTSQTAGQADAALRSGQVTGQFYSNLANAGVKAGTAYALYDEDGKKKRGF